MDEFARNSKLLMPHEDLERPRQKIPFLDRMSFLKNVFVDLMRMRFSNYERKIDICQNLFNGGNAGTIHRKYDFIEQVRKLGYLGPEQILYSPGQDIGLEKAKSLFEKHGSVLCKPKDGQQGQGIFLCEDVSELMSKLKSAKEA